jgi:hypothetical protein
MTSGSVEWQGEIDLSYDTLYLESKSVKGTQSQRKATRSTKKNLAVVSLPKKKPSKARVAAK